jgi:hypothetical protein
MPLTQTLCLDPLVCLAHAARQTSRAAANRRYRSPFDLKAWLEWNDRVNGRKLIPPVGDRPTPGAY